jgi:hypothetical protein
MRTFARFFGLSGGFVMIVIAARFGFKTSDNDLDGYIWAFTYGSVTLGGLFGHSLALRVWRHNQRIGALVMVISALALTISLSNSIGAMAGRGNEKQAKRLEVAENVRGWRRDIERDQKKRDGMQFKPTDEAAVEAAKKATAAATAAKEAECKSGRGSACKTKEGDEAKALADEKATIQDKNATDTAAKLDANIKGFEDNIKRAGPVLEADSQGSALARLFNLPDTQAATLSTYQNLAMAVVIELLFVISLVASEVLEHHEAKLPAQADAEVRSTALGMAVSVPRVAAVQVATRQTMDLVPMREELEPDETQPLLERPKPVRQITSQREPFGNVIDIAAKVMEPGSGSKVEIKEAYFAYAHVCKEQGKKPFPPDKFAAEIKRFCKEARVKIHAEEHGVYLLNVRLKASEKQELEDQAS